MLEDSYGFNPQRPRDLIDKGDNVGAVAYIEHYIRSGSVYAMIAMADYLFDRGEKDASLSWMDRAEQSIKKDDFESPIYLSSAYTRGLGRGEAYERHKKAFTLLEQVGESGNLVVIHEMMRNFHFGLNGAPKDRERYLYWAKKAVAQGSELGLKAVKDSQL